MTEVAYRDPPNRGLRWFFANQTSLSRAVLFAGIGVLSFFSLGTILVLNAFGWTQACPEGARASECSTVTPLVEGLTSSGLGQVATITVIAGLAVAVVGFARYRSMPTKSSREATFAGGVLALQGVALAAVLGWFRGTEVERFARNFLDVRLLGENLGLTSDAFGDEFGSILVWTIGWAIATFVLVYGVMYARRHLSRSAAALSLTPPVIGAVSVAIVVLFGRLAAISELPSFVRAGWNTLRLSLSGAALGFGLGLVIAVFLMSSRSVVRAPARVYVNFFRGTPLIWQITFFGIGFVPALRLGFFTEEDFLSPILGTGAYRVAIFVLGLNLAAYSSEVYRSGIQSLERGQIEASRSLGLSYLQSLRYVIVPQAIRRVIPPLLNEFVILIKDTSLVSVLGLTLAEKELLGTGRDIYSSTFDATAFLGAAIGFLIITLPMVRIVTIVEKRMRSGLTSVIG
jgi:polar amino acid transport system permease protein